MGNWKSYRTGLTTGSRPILIPGYEYEEEPQPPYKGKAWYATLDPCEEADDFDVAHPIYAPEVIIHAKSHRSAQNALDLILQSLWLLHGGSAMVEDLLAWNDEYLSGLDSDERIRADMMSESSLSIGGIPTACSLAAKASFRRKYVYALAKYTFSIHMCSTYPIDLEPFRAPYLPKESRPLRQIIFCHSIISAYSVIEELGLEVRASNEKPAKVNGQWNLVVKEDLEKRLLSAGIDLTKQYLWTQRGPKRRPERKRKPRVQRPAEWAWGNVRDDFVDVVDAIDYARWLRSGVASHKFNQLAASLLPYDVENVQGLAGRLLLECLRS